MSDATNERVAKAWPPMKKAIWDVLMDANLNVGYLAARPLTEKLYAAALTAAEAENKRLREALERIEWLESECFGIFPEGDEDEGFIGYAVTSGKTVLGSGPQIDDAIDSARAALTGGTDND